MRQPSLPLSSALYAVGIKPVLKFLNQTIYVQVTKNAFSILHVQTNKQTVVQAASPFSTERLGVGHFNQAAEALAKGIAQVYTKSLFNPSPVMVMHQLYLAEGGLCEIEDRILRELALGAGAREVFVWSGEPLTKEQLVGKVYESGV
jgi:rod shape-determining protein MreB